MFSWLIRLSGLALSWHYTDLESSAAFQNTISPILVAVFLISVLVKIVTMMGPGNGTGGSGGSDGGGFFGGSGGSDGGCGGGGGDC